MVDAAALAACTRCESMLPKGIIFVSFATDRHFLHQIEETARGVHNHARARCICVAVPGESLKPSANESRLVQVPVKIDRFAIDPKFCDTMKGWRIVSLLKTTLINRLVGGGHDIFSIDADWRMRAKMALPNADVVSRSWKGSLFQRRAVRPQHTRDAKSSRTRRESIVCRVGSEYNERRV